MNRKRPAEDNDEEEEAPSKRRSIHIDELQTEIDHILSTHFDKKKAFQYQLIDKLEYLQLTIDYDDDDDDDEETRQARKNKCFQQIYVKLSRALESCTTVFAGRVEILFNESHKFDKSLSSKRSTPDDDEDEDSDHETGRRKRRRPNERRRRTTQFVASDPRKLNDKLSTCPVIDPVSVKFAKAFDVGNVNSLLLSNVNSKPNGLFLVDSTDVFDFSNVPPPERAPVNDQTFLQHLNFQWNEDSLLVNLTAFCDRDSDSDSVSSPLPVSHRHLPSSSVHHEFDPNAPVDDVGFEENPDFSSDEANINGDNPADIAGDGNHLFSKTYLVQHNLLTDLASNPKPKKAPKRREPRRHYEPNVYQIDVAPIESLPERICQQRKRTVLRWLKRKPNLHLENMVSFDHNELFVCFSSPTSFSEITALGESLKQAENQGAECSNQAGQSAPMDGPFEDPHDDLHDDNEYNYGESPAPKDGNNVGGPPEREERYIEALNIEYALTAKQLNIRKLKRSMRDIIKANSMPVS